MTTIYSVGLHPQDQLTTPEVEKKIITPTIDPISPAGLPGVFSIVTFPYDLVKNLISYIKATALHDREGRDDAVTRLYSLGLNLFSSVQNLSSFFCIIATFFHNAKLAIINFNIPTRILSIMNVAGVCLCFLEVILEATAVFRSTKFLSIFHSKTLNKFETFLKEEDPNKKRKLLIACCKNIMKHKDSFVSQTVKGYLGDLMTELAKPIPLEKHILDFAEQALKAAYDDILIHDGTQIQNKYLVLSDEKKERIERVTAKKFRKTPEKIDEEIHSSERRQKQIQINCLARRVAPWCAKELSTKLSPLLNKMSTCSSEEKDLVRKELKDLLDTTRKQGQKYLVTHIVSLIIFSVAKVAYVGLLLSPAAPFVISATFFGLGVLSTINFMAHEGYIHNKGWTFSLYYLLPMPVRFVWEKSKAYFTAKKEAKLKNQVTQLSNNSCCRKVSKIA
jgi:hypothetical protein